MLFVNIAQKEKDCRKIMHFAHVTTVSMYFNTVYSVPRPSGLP